MLHFVLCDDNVQILDRLEKTLNSLFIKHDIDAVVSFKAKNSCDFFNYLEDHSVDVLILDINLKSSISGCDIAAEVRKKSKNIYIIFLTGHFEYALLAYKYKTFDYLIKPLTDERLEETLLRLIVDISDSHSSFIKLNERIVVNQDDINYIKKDGMKLVFCSSNMTHEIYGSFSEILNRLPNNFIRCHKSYIVNINNVNRFISSKNIVTFAEGSSCSVGAKYKNKFLEVFKNESFSNYLGTLN